MDVQAYLEKQGWKKGEPLQKGGLKHPLLVKHRKDTKGLGYNPLANEGWWERVFDGHLQSLEVTGGDSIAFKQDEEILRKKTSALYAKFRSGGILEGTIKEDAGDPLTDDKKNRSKKRKSDVHKSETKHKKHKKEGKRKSSDKKHKKDKRKHKKLKTE